MHSLSPCIHQHFATQCGLTLCYEKILSQANEVQRTVRDFFKQGGTGLNITAPFKEQAFLMAECLTSRCQQAKSANTLWMQKGKLYADTTDGIGLLRDLSRHLSLSGTHILLLGAGGAARSIIAPLFAMDIASLTVFNRTQARANALQADFPLIRSCSLSELAPRYDLILNATPHFSQVHDLPPASYCYDLTYQQDGCTPFVTWARQQGTPASDGLGMLIEQAAEAFFIWHGIMPKTQPLIENRLNLA